MNNTQKTFTVPSWASTDEVVWATQMWRDYRIRWNGKVVFVKPNLSISYTFANIIPIRVGKIITHFKWEPEDDWFPMNPTEQLLVEKYLLNHPCIIEDIPFDNFVWETIDTKILNRDNLIDFVCEGTEQE